MGKPHGKGPHVLGLAFVADDERTLEEVEKAVSEALQRVGADGALNRSSDPWSQSGGWVREQDGWPQSGGWYLSTNRIRLDESIPPLESSVADVFAALERAKRVAAGPQ